MVEPLTPSDCDCRGLAFMPLEVGRLIDSDFTALSTGDEFKAGLLLWTKSWTQVPAASLPSDDRILARLAGCSLQDWEAVRSMALHNWVLCDDGRYYHPVIADLAVRAAAKRRGQSARANSRWARARAQKDAAALPRDQKPDAAASTGDATAMQGTDKVEGIEPPLAPPVSEEPKRRRRKAEAPIPDDFPDAAAIDEMQQRCRIAGVNVDASVQAVFFRNHAETHSRKCSDWKAAFRQWIDKHIHDPKTPRLAWTAPRREAPQPVADDLWRVRLRVYKAEGYWDERWGGNPRDDDCLCPPEILRETGYGAPVLRLVGE